MDLLQIYCKDCACLLKNADRIFLLDAGHFAKMALNVFEWQYKTVEIYRRFCESLRRFPSNVRKPEEIPFLPVEFFKTHTILAEGKQAQATFESSGTTGSIPSRHFIADLGIYEQSFLKTFERFYGSPENYVILGLLPSYLERNNSSLVYMVNRLMELSGRKEGGFFLYEQKALRDLLLQLRDKKQQVLLIGVTFALLDFAEQFKIDFPDLIVMETGGMKGRKEELMRAEVHEKLCAGFGVNKIHSEYGMTELLSQGYSKGNGIFETPPWMKILTRDIYDPLRILEHGEPGAINIIDLANIYSCSFIATNDLGSIYADGSFEIIGRTDNAEIRGCNLMVI